MSTILIDPYRFGIAGVTTEVFSFTKQAGTGTQDVTIATDLTGAAAGTWAILFWTAGSDVGSGTWDDQIYSSLGFVANGGGSISQYAVAASAEDNVATSNTGRRMAAKAITIAAQSGSATTDEADFVGFQSATTMRLNWTSQGHGRAAVINGLLVSGLTGAKVVNWTTPTTAINKAVTGVGFNPDLVLHATAMTNSVPLSATLGLLGFGMMNKHGQQAANGIYSEDGFNPSQTSRYQQTDAALATVGSSDAIQYQAHFVSMDADGFTVNFSNSAGGTQNVISLCLDGVSSKIGAFVTDAASPQTVATRSDFTPKAVMFSGFGTAPSGSPVGDAVWSLGASDLTNQRAVSLNDRDNVTPTNADSIWISGVAGAHSAGAGPTLFQTLSVSSVSASDVVVTKPTNTANGYETLYLLLGDSGTNTFPAMVVV